MWLACGVCLHMGRVEEMVATAAAICGLVGLGLSIVGDPQTTPSAKQLASSTHRGLLLRCRFSTGRFPGIVFAAYHCRPCLSDDHPCSGRGPVIPPRHRPGDPPVFQRSPSREPYRSVYGLTRDPLYQFLRINSGVKSHESAASKLKLGAQLKLPTQIRINETASLLTWPLTRQFA